MLCSLTTCMAYVRTTQVALYAFGKCDKATRSLLLNDPLVDMEGLSKSETADTLFAHVFQG